MGALWEPHGNVMGTQWDINGTSNGDEEVFSSLLVIRCF